MATIFDCDGTLVDSERLCQEVMVECIAEYGLLLSVEDALQRFRGGNMANCVATFETMLGHSLPEQFVPNYRRRLAVTFRERLQPVTGARQVVQSAPGPIAVASSGPPEKIRLSLELTELLPYFGPHLYSCYELNAWKPDPKIFLHTAKRLGVPPADCTVVEDSMPGILAGLAAGMRVIAYQEAEIDPAIPDEVIVVRHFAEVGPLLR